MTEILKFFEFFFSCGKGRRYVGEDETTVGVKSCIIVLFSYYLSHMKIGDDLLCFVETKKGRATEVPNVLVQKRNTNFRNVVSGSRSSIISEALHNTSRASGYVGH